MARECTDSAQSPSCAIKSTPALCPFRSAAAVAASSNHDVSFTRVILPLFRHIGAAYTTGVSDCWEAAYLLAEDAAGISEGPFLIARVATLVRIFRNTQSPDVIYLPRCCTRLSKHEARLMALTETARAGLRSELKQSLFGLVHPDQEAAALQALAALAELSFASSLTGPSAGDMERAVRKNPVPLSSEHPGYAEQF